MKHHAPRSPRRLFDSLVDRAFGYGHMTGNPQKRRYAIHFRKVRAGEKDPEDLPEDLKPGWLIKRLKPEDRETLRGLTSDMVVHRDDLIVV